MIYALCRILVKCRDLRIFPGKKFRIPGTKNYYAALLVGFGLDGIGISVWGDYMSNEDRFLMLIIEPTTIIHKSDFYA